MGTPDDHVSEQAERYSLVEKPTPVQAAVSLVIYRRELLADAKKARAETSRLVRRCEKALRIADAEMRDAIIRSKVVGQ